MGDLNLLACYNPAKDEPNYTPQSVIDAIDLIMDSDEESKEVK